MYTDIPPEKRHPQRCRNGGFESGRDDGGCDDRPRACAGQTQADGKHVGIGPTRLDMRDGSTPGVTGDDQSWRVLVLVIVRRESVLVSRMTMVADVNVLGQGRQPEGQQRCDQHIDHQPRHRRSLHESGRLRRRWLGAPAPIPR